MFGLPLYYRNQRHRAFGHLMGLRRTNPLISPLSGVGSLQTLAEKFVYIIRICISWTQISWQKIKAIFMIPVRHHHNEISVNIVIGFTAIVDDEGPENSILVFGIVVRMPPCSTLIFLVNISLKCIWVRKNIDESSIPQDSL